MRWNNLSIPQLQGLYLCSLRKDIELCPTLVRDYLCILLMSLNHVSKRGHLEYSGNINIIDFDNLCDLNWNWNAINLYMAWVWT